MYSAGRQGMTDDLGPGGGRLEADERGRITVDEHFRTAVPHIYAVGDVIGFPALASTSMEQGRLAAHHACGEPVHAAAPAAADRHLHASRRSASSGQTEDELTAAREPVRGRHLPLPRAGPRADHRRLVRHAQAARLPGDRRLLGVHVFGTGATELVHIGQAVMGCGGTVDYLVDTVFNYPTLAEAYKVAALDATNKMRQVARFA